MTTSTIIASIIILGIFLSFVLKMFLSEVKYRLILEKEELRLDKIRYTAYLLAEKDGFRKSSDEYWLEAEKMV